MASTSHGVGFTSYASRFLAQSVLSTTSQAEPPLFYSTTQFEAPSAHDDDVVLGDGNDSPFDEHSLPSSREPMGPSEAPTSSDDERKPPYPGSRLWENAGLPAFSRLGATARGWKAHESTLSQAPPPRSTARIAASDVYAEFEEVDEPEYDSTGEDGDSSPPSFLAALPLPGAFEPPTEPLLAPRTLYVYPSQGRNGGVGQGAYRDSTWIVLYGLAVIAAAITGLRLLWLGWDSTNSTLLPSLPTLSLLSLLSLVAGLLSLFYLFSLPSAIRHSLTLTLIAGPVILVAVGFIAFAGSFGNQGVEGDRGWKNGVRIFGLLCWIAAALLVRTGLRRRKSVERTVKVLELAVECLLAHPPLILLCLGLSLVSTVLSLPFLFILASLLSDPFHHSHGLLLNWGSVGVLGTYIWTMEILRGLQRVTVSGVVGGWYFERHEEGRPGIVEITRASFARATGPSLGTIIASSFLLSLFSTLSTAITKLKTFLRSKSVPVYLQPLTYLIPLLSVLGGLLEIFTGYVLVHTGLSGDNFSSSARKVARTLRNNNTSLISDNLLVKTLLFVTSLLWSTLAGIVAFLLASSRISDPRLSPVLGALCLIVPGWVMRLCGGMVVDAADTLFMAFNLDLERNTEHCAKATEAFGEPDTDSLA